MSAEDLNAEGAETQRRHRIVIDSAYNLGDFVVLKCDPEGGVGCITGLNLRPAGLIYDVAWGNKQFQAHYEMELAPGNPPTNSLA